MSLLTSLGVEPSRVHFSKIHMGSHIRQEPGPSQVQLGSGSGLSHFLPPLACDSQLLCSPSEARCSSENIIFFLHPPNSWYWGVEGMAYKEGGKFRWEKITKNGHNQSNITNRW